MTVRRMGKRNNIRHGPKETGIPRYYHQCKKADETMTDSLLSKQRNKILEKFADHILKESCAHALSGVVREPLILEDETHHKAAVSG